MTKKQNWTFVESMVHAPSRFEVFGCRFHELGASWSRFDGFGWHFHAAGASWSRFDVFGCRFHERGACWSCFDDFGVCFRVARGFVFCCLFGSVCRLLFVATFLFLKRRAKRRIRPQNRLILNIFQGPLSNRRRRDNEAKSPTKTVPKKASDKSEI